MVSPFRASYSRNFFVSFTHIWLQLLETGISNSQLVKKEKNPIFYISFSPVFGLMCSIFFCFQVINIRGKNALNFGNPITQQLVLDSLEYWAAEYHVDGFVFENAYCLLRGRDGEIDPMTPMLEAIVHDPIIGM